MSRKICDNILESQQKPHFEHDARVEVLLFLGIVFWCWLIVMFFQGRLFPSSPEIPWQLSWNGEGLRTVQGREVELSNPGWSTGSNGDKGSGSLPPAVTPFLFLPIPINFADAQLLATISGIGPKLADQIVQTRETKGLFTKPHDLLAVPGIGPSRMKTFGSQFSFATAQ